MTGAKTPKNRWKMIENEKRKVKKVIFPPQRAEGEIYGMND
jgi:hypothetical protein